MAWKAIDDLKRGFLEAFDAASALPISVTGLGLATEATLAAIAALLSSGGQSVAALAASILARLPAIGPQAAAASMSVIASQQPCIVAPVEISITDGNSTQSVALTAGRYIITADLDVAFIQASNPTATAASCKLPEGTFRWVDVTEGGKIAAIRKNAGETGTVSLERQA